MNLKDDEELSLTPDMKNDKDNKEKNEKKPTGWAVFWEYFKVVLIGVLIALFLCKFVLINAVIPTRSMVPTINVGERLIGLRVPYYFSDPKRGDIVIFKAPEATGDKGKLYIKRVIGLPGETIKIKAGEAYLVEPDGTERYIDNVKWYKNTPSDNNMNNYMESITLGPNEYFVMGDNRDNSFDSRGWGPVTRKAILAKAWLKYYKGFCIMK